MWNILGQQFSSFSDPETPTEAQRHPGGRLLPEPVQVTRVNTEKEKDSGKNRAEEHRCG